MGTDDDGVVDVVAAVNENLAFAVLKGWVTGKQDSTAKLLRWDGQAWTPCTMVGWDGKAWVEKASPTCQCRRSPEEWGMSPGQPWIASDARHASLHPRIPPACLFHNRRRPTASGASTLHSAAGARRAGRSPSCSLERTTTRAPSCSWRPMAGGCPR